MKQKNFIFKDCQLNYDSAAAWLAQLGERRSAERAVTGTNPGLTTTQGL